MEGSLVVEVAGSSDSLTWFLCRLGTGACAGTRARALLRV